MFAALIPPTFISPNRIIIRIFRIERRLTLLLMPHKMTICQAIRKWQAHRQWKTISRFVNQERKYIEKKIIIEARSKSHEHLIRTCYWRHEQLRFAFPLEMLAFVRLTAQDSTTAHLHQEPMNFSPILVGSSVCANVCVCVLPFFLDCKIAKAIKIICRMAYKEWLYNISKTTHSD